MEKTDIISVGGGMVGLLGAIALARQEFHVRLIEKASRESMIAPRFDGRTIAIAQGSAAYMQQVGVWDDIAPYACPIEKIRISDGDSHQHLDYDHRMVGEKPLGYVVENRHVLAALHRAAAEIPTLIFEENTHVAGMKVDTGQVEIYTDRGQKRAASLLIATDGRLSPLRAMAGLSWEEKKYHQSAIVCTVSHEKPHGFIAQERFLPAGPFAILPMVDDSEGRHRSSLVWTEKTRWVADFIALDEKDFTAEIARRFTDYLGKIVVLGKRFSYPLFFGYAPSLVGTRVVLAGDAGHVMHPIAGQGANLGFRDWEIVVPLLVEARLQGRDIGTSSVLETYHHQRQFDVQSMLQATDGLNALFSNTNPFLAGMRRAGLTAIQHFPPAKKLFMRHAMGQLHG